MHVVDPSAAATDQVPPTLPPILAYDVYRAKEPGACNGSCESGHISFVVDATDDMTPPERIGYRLQLQAGALPTGLRLPAGAIEGGPASAIEGGQAGPRLWLYWDSLASDGTEPIGFTLQVIAIDLAGNESAPQTVRIHDDPGGCAIARGGPARRPVAWLAVAALVLAARPRSGVRSRRR
jgi:hypothetical protein